jgi:hypothetical protein
MVITKTSLLIGALAAVPAAGTLALTLSDTIDVSEIRAAPLPRDPISFTRGVQRAPVLACLVPPIDAPAREAAPAPVGPLPRFESATRAATRVRPAPLARSHANPSRPAVLDITVSMTDPIDAPAVAPSRDLGAAIAGAVGARPTASPRHDDGPIARQLRPAPGAVMAALRSVLPSARACLAPEDAELPVRVVFRSDGSVAQVDASHACVRRALAGAHVDPFAAESFATQVTVRPDVH